MTDTVCAVVVTHQRPDELAKSLDAVSAQTRAPDHLVVVDNDERHGALARSRVLDWCNQAFQDSLRTSKPRTHMPHNAESAVKQRYAAL